MINNAYINQIRVSDPSDGSTGPDDTNEIDGTYLVAGDRNQQMQPNSKIRTRQDENLENQGCNAPKVILLNCLLLQNTPGVRINTHEQILVLIGHDTNIPKI